MASRNYLSNSKAGFFEDENDIDDETFLRESMHFQNSSSKETFKSNDKKPDYSDSEDLGQYTMYEMDQMRKKRIKEAIARTMQSSERSLGLLRDSEQIGQATAEELLRQREQLAITERRLDDINSTLRFSQRHIQGIKSVFGSFKNYLSGKTNELPPLQPINSPSTLNNFQSDNPSSSNLHDSRLSTVLQDRAELGLSSSEDHPSLRLRGLDGTESRLASLSLEQALDKNLTDIGGSVSRLKELARGLGDEIDDQNELLEKIMNKTDRADISVNNQNKQMQRLLK